MRCAGFEGNDRFVTKALPVMLVGAEERNRTPDLLITNELLYRLSYFGNTADRSAKRLALLAKQSN